MIFKVHLLAFGEPGEVREVNVPDEKTGRKTTKTSQQDFLLDLVFQYGQNDFQPQPHPSVSMGDVVELNEKYFLVKAVGFKEITEEKFKAYAEMDRRDRIISSLGDR